MPARLRPLPVFEHFNPRFGRLASGCCVGLVALGASASAQSFRLDGIVSLTGAALDSRAPWLEGSWGRLVNGRGQPAEPSSDARGQLQLGFDWEPTTTLLLHAHGVARLEPSAARGSPAGLSEAYLQYRREKSPTTSLRLRGGLLFPGFSRENVGPLWSSPYTVTLSGVNSWIAEEVRLLGLESRLRLGAGESGHLDLAGTLFWGNDTAGALLAWRGWAFHDRLVAVNETLPLPPLPSLGRTGTFSKQRDDGTRPIDELDDRAGWMARVAFSRPGETTLQAVWYDNRGDRGLHGGQYAWDTRFGSVGGDIALSESWTLAGEVTIGDTTMGDPAKAAVNVRFRAGYGLLSWTRAAWRFTLRYDRFQNTDNDGMPDPDDEEGDALTLASFWSPWKGLRLGLEFLLSNSERSAARVTPAGTDMDARRALLEARYSF